MQPTSVPLGFPASNRISMPCIACGSPLAVDGSIYCPVCQAEIVLEETLDLIVRIRMSYLDDLERELSSRAA